MKITNLRINVTTIDKETQKLTGWVTKLSEATSEIEHVMKQNLPLAFQRDLNLRCLSCGKDQNSSPKADGNNLDISHLSQTQSKVLKLDQNPYMRMQVENKSRNTSNTPKLRMRTTKRQMLQSADPRKRTISKYKTMSKQKYLDQLRINSQLNNYSIGL